MSGFSGELTHAGDRLLQLAGNARSHTFDGARIHFWGYKEPERDLAAAIADVMPDKIGGFEAMIGIPEGSFDSIFPRGVKLWLTARSDGFRQLTMGHVDSDPVDDSCILRSVLDPSRQEHDISTSVYDICGEFDATVKQTLASARTVSCAADYVTGLVFNAAASAPQ